MTHYILQVIFFQLVFLLAYEFLLKKETYFNANRAYLLLTPVLALLLPLLKIEMLGSLFPVESVQGWTSVVLPEVFIGNQTQVIQQLPAVVVKENEFQINWWLVFYGFGMLAALMLFLKRFATLNRLSRFRKISEEKKFSIIEVPNSNIACTFLNTVFLGDKIKEGEKQQILSHELVHIKQKHSFDLLFFELQKIVFWFNPLIYIYQNRISTLHEFIADANVVKTTEKRSYYEQLLNSAFSTRNISFINQFFNHSLIKKRIIMLQKSRSKSIAKFKFLIIIPLMMLMLTYVACSDDKSSEITEEDLSQYSYTLEKGKEMTQEQKEIHKAYEDFLINNPNYVSWAKIEGNRISYEVHPADQEVPPNYTKTSVGELYVMYMNFETEENKKFADFSGQETMGEYKDNEIPFGLIENVPVFEGCENLTSNEERKNCMATEIASFVNREFNKDLPGNLNLKGTNRIVTQFKINTQGSIVGVKARASHPALEEEAVRVISKLPKMIPGKHDGSVVDVMYSLPIVFQVGG